MIENTNGTQAARPRLVALDSLRFVAAAAVLFQHGVEQQGPLGKAIVGWTSPGVFGVALFFLISGYVIPMSVGRSLDLKSFAIRRLLRIYPPVLVAFALVAVLARLTVWPAFDAARSASARDWVANLLLIEDYVGAAQIHGVTWTLSLELAWYGLFAILTLWVGKRFVEPLLVLFPLVLLTMGVLSLAIGHRVPLAHPGMIYAAAVGCQIYRYHAGEVPARRLAVDAGLFAAVMLICNLISFGYFKHSSITVGQAVIPWLAATGFFLAVTLITRMRLSPLFNNPVVAWLGAMSFSIYLLHPFGLALAEAILPRPWDLPAALVLTLVISFAGYRLIELPSITLSKRLTPRVPMAVQPKVPSDERAA